MYLKITLLKFYNLVFFGVFTELCNFTTISFWNIFITPERNPIPISSYFFPFSQALSTANLLLSL